MTDTAPSEGPGAEIVHLDPSSSAHAVVAQTMASVGMPSPAEWAALTGMAEQLSRSKLVPSNLRGEPDDIMLLLLTGRDLQIAPTQALNKINVIEGKPSISPELMVALVRRAGYPIWPAEGNDRAHATACAEREGRHYEFTFTIEDAQLAGLCTIKDGRAVALSQKGNPLPWQTYTQFLLWARAVSGLCRMVFADVLMGVTYVPEELGASVNPETGEIIEATADDYRPAGSGRDEDAAARQGGWQSVADFAEHRDRLQAVLDLLDPEIRAKYNRWATNQSLMGMAEPLGKGPKAAWEVAYAKAVEKANPGTMATADPISGGPVAEPVLVAGAPDDEPFAGDPIPRAEPRGPQPIPTAEEVARQAEAQQARSDEQTVSFAERVGGEVPPEVKARHAARLERAKASLAAAEEAYKAPSPPKAPEPTEAATTGQTATQAAEEELRRASEFLAARGDPGLAEMKAHELSEMAVRMELSGNGTAPVLRARIARHICEGLDEVAAMRAHAEDDAERPF